MDVQCQIHQNNFCGNFTHSTQYNKIISGLQVRFVSITLFTGRISYFVVIPCEFMIYQSRNANNLKDYDVLVKRH